MAQRCILQVQTVWESDSNSPRYPRKLWYTIRTEVPRPRCFSAAAFPGNDGNCLKNTQCRVGGMVWSFSLVLRVLSRFTGNLGASDLISYRSPVNLIKGVVPACVPKFGSTFLDINITQNYQFLVAVFCLQSCVTAPKIVVPDKGEKIGVDSLEDTRRRSISVALPNASPITRYGQKWLLYIKQVVMRTRGITAMPRSILRVSICKFNLTRSLNRTFKGITMSALLFVFWLSFGRFCIFFRIIGWVISLEKINDKRGPKLNASISAWTTPCPKINPNS